MAKKAKKAKKGEAMHVAKDSDSGARRIRV